MDEPATPRVIHRLFRGTGSKGNSPRLHAGHNSRLVGKGFCPLLCGWRFGSFFGWRFSSFFGWRFGSLFGCCDSLIERLLRYLMGLGSAA